MIQVQTLTNPPPDKPDKYGQFKMRERLREGIEEGRRGMARERLLRGESPDVSQNDVLEHALNTPEMLRLREFGKPPKDRL